MQPGMEPGATEVFLDFISYSVGPMVEELLAANEKPVVLGWGDKVCHAASRQCSPSRRRLIHDASSVAQLAGPMGKAGMGL